MTRLLRIDAPRGWATTAGLLAGLLCGCATGPTPPPSAPMAPSAMPVTSAASTALVFADLASFDRQLARSLSTANGPVTVTSADVITMRQLPPRLEKWLAAVDDSGGKIETQSVDASEPQTRSLGLIMAIIGAIRQAAEFVKQDQYAEARNIDAKLFYRRDATGDRVLERVEWLRR